MRRRHLDQVGRLRRARSHTPEREPTSRWAPIIFDGGDASLERLAPMPALGVADIAQNLALSLA
jgi:hypothetical protein